VTSAEEITRNANALDARLKECLRELQRRISEAVQEIEEQNTVEKTKLIERKNQNKIR